MTKQDEDEYPRRWRGSKDLLLKPCPASEQSGCVWRNHLAFRCMGGRMEMAGCTCDAMRNEEGRKLDRKEDAFIEVDLLCYA